ncbi:hypothetical protein HMPREF3039_00657 [Akkermansia sp. KLE1798]|nr:hypothetical protein HMPREF3039_00657 [Akkermansia sp. KLE1798]
MNHHKRVSSLIGKGDRSRKKDTLFHKVLSIKNLLSTNLPIKNLEKFC